MEWVWEKEEVGREEVSLREGRSDVGGSGNGEGGTEVREWGGGGGGMK